LVGQQIGGVEGRTLIAQRNGRPSTHPDPGVVVPGSVGERGRVPVPAKGLDTVAAGKCLPIQRRQLGADSPEARGVELLLKDDQVGGHAFLDLTGA
jgi:hypothetical protein